MKTDALFSDCRKYRYALWRIWDDSKPLVMFVGLNPSTADKSNDDMTVRRCINYARSWGYGGICVANLFAFRATFPRDLMAASDLIGPENDAWLEKLSKSASIVVAAWGTHGGHLSRAEQVIKLIPNLYCLKITKSGSPAHPLYIESTLVPMPMAS